MGVAAGHALFVSGLHPMALTAFEHLQQNHPWPDITDLHAWDYTLGGGGRELVDELITDINPAFMLEIGCFLCSSARRWLSLSPTLKLVGVDPWEDSLIDQCRRYIGRPALSRAYPDPYVQQDFITDIEGQGPFPTALANLRGFEDRFVPVRGYSPDILPSIQETGFKPDIIYIDASKHAADLDVCHDLWPEAFICGDDWHWGRTKGYPMRQIVYAFAEKHGFTVTADHATWVLQRF